MTESSMETGPIGEVSGQMFLYEKPELLTPEAHGNLGFKPAERPYDFVRNVRAVPITMVEFGTAQRDYPIVFSNDSDPVPLAVVGLLDDVNLFVGDDGQWDPMCYVPGYLRCHPFAAAAEDEERMAIVVDAAAPNVSENPDYPFFVDGKVSEQADALMRLVAQYEHEKRRTREFCKKVVDLGLLTNLRATHKTDSESEPQAIADYVAINVDKLNELDKDTVYELHQAGFLSACYLQLYSLENWRHLMARKLEAQKAA